MNPALPVKPGLFVLALCSFAFWWICRSLERSITASIKAGHDLAVAATTQYTGMAHEGAGII
jgi:hypothetical protein